MDPRGFECRLTGSPPVCRSFSQAMSEEAIEAELPWPEHTYLNMFENTVSANFPGRRTNAPPQTREYAHASCV
eukprot:1177275-Prorocentrum_minimum.AAC.5